MFVSAVPLALGHGALGLLSIICAERTVDVDLVLGEMPLVVASHVTLVARVRLNQLAPSLWFSGGHVNLPERESSRRLSTSNGSAHEGSGTDQCLRR